LIVEESVVNYARFTQRNLLLIGVLFVTIAFSAYQEGYLRILGLPYTLVLLWGVGMSVWLAMSASMARMLSLVLSIFTIEYVKEALGTRYGFWIYHGINGSFVFGVWSWVLGGLSCYSFATKVVVPILRKWLPPISRGWNPVMVLGLALFGFVLLGKRVQEAGWLYWFFYLVLILVALSRSMRFDVSLWLGLILGSFAVSNLGEFVGATINELWTFPGEADYPPLFLLFACWPIEILAQTTLSVLLVPLSSSEAEIYGIGKRRIEMVSGREEEKQAALFLKISSAAYFLVGWAFLFLPDQILAFFNWLSSWLLPTWPVTPISGEHFWTALAFSMMMTITALSFVAARNIRKYRLFVVILLISKCASSVSAFSLFVFQTHYLSYLGIAVIDGTIFWITLAFFLRANKAFFEEQTFFLHKPPKVIETTPPTTVVVLKGEDKFALLDQIVAEAGFWDVLERQYLASGKSKQDFRVVIKPNFMYMHSRKDTSTYTDPALVERLVDLMVDHGFTNVALVEAQSTYGNYYQNREVRKVAEYIGYSTNKNYRLVDLTQEMVPFEYGGRLGSHFVGPTWRDADFRISFAKNKTHVFCHYTLTLKNIYGTLPLQNKLKEYHTKREYDWPTIETMKHFPVHFGLVDAFTSADGQFGVISDPKPIQTKTLLAGENLIAVDWVGAKKMGLDPDAPGVGRFLQLAIEAFGRPERIDWVGDKSCYQPWKNVSEVFIKSLDVIEEAEAFSDWWFGCLTAMDPYFKFKLTTKSMLFMRKILAPVKRLFFPYDDLSR
jgi:uncharacterized protein (DUF362 family)